MKNNDTACPVPFQNAALLRTEHTLCSTCVIPRASEIGPTNQKTRGRLTKDSNNNQNSINCNNTKPKGPST